MRARPVFFAFIAGAAFAGSLITACFPTGSKPVESATREESPDLRADELKTIDIFRDASKSVVFISNNTFVRQSFFSPNVEEVPQGTGSGFVWDKKGHIVTNSHVIWSDGAPSNQSIRVTLDDHTQYRAKVVGTYSDKEIAVLQISAPAEKLYPIKVGKSSDLQVGQTALAIGNPFGLDHTLTVGVISALGREIQALTRRRINDVIQTDAAINPGNSGGPLLNSSGLLIGMNTAILSPSGVNSGIGFALPIDTIGHYVEQIIRNGKVSGAGLGVAIVADYYARGLGIRQGVLLDTVYPNSAAAKAGLRGTQVDPNGEVLLGDIVTGINAKKVVDVNSLRDALEPFLVGDEVEVTFQRKGTEKKAQVKLQQIEIQ